MANGGASLNKGSELVYDYSCSKCAEFDLNIEAQHFCPDCEYYLCDKCVKLHNGFHRKHTVYGRGDIQKWAGFDLDICDQHGNKLEVHCDDHQELCCHVCVALNHRQCSSISHLPDLARDFLKTAEIKQLPGAVGTMMRRLDELKNARMKYEAYLKDTQNVILAEIKALRKEMNEKLDQLEKRTVIQLDNMIKGFDTNIKADVEYCTHMHDQLKFAVEKVQQVTDKHNETNSYIGYRRCQEKLIKAEKQVQKIQRKPEQKIRFMPDITLKPFLKNLHVLWTIENFEIKQYDVGIESDKHRPLIVGISQLPSGDFVIADQNNNRVKLLNSQYVVTTSCDLPASPDHLCHTSGNEVVVVVSDNCNRHEVHFIQVTRGKLQKVRMFTTDHRCNTIAHHQGQLYLSSKNTLNQHDMNGRLMKTLHENMYRGYNVRFCVVSPDGERIYVTSHLEPKLITLDKAGNVLSSLEKTKLSYPRGLCLSSRGHVFVCGCGSETVMQVKRDGTQKLATLVREADGVSVPWSLSFNERTSSLLVGNVYITSVAIKLTSGV